MVPGADGHAALARIEGGALRALPDSLRGQTALQCDWGAIQALQVEVEPQELPEGVLVNHLVALNLGAEAAGELRLASDQWRPLRVPHHGLALYPAGVPHAVRVQQPRPFLLVQLTPAFVETIAAASGGGALRPVLGVPDAFARHVLLALGEEARRGAPGGALRAEGLATALAGHLLELGSRPAPTPPPVALPSPHLRRVLDHVAAHLDAPLTLRALAALAGMDQFRFIRAFKQSTGLSPHRYVLEARIARAKELLRDPRLSITDVALQTGFATPSHFSVTFRRIANATPRAFRDGLG